MLGALKVKENNMKASAITLCLSPLSSLLSPVMRERGSDERGGRERGNDEKEREKEEVMREKRERGSDEREERERGSDERGERNRVGPCPPWHYHKPPLGVCMA